MAPAFFWGVAKTFSVGERGATPSATDLPNPRAYAKTAEGRALAIGDGQIANRTPRPEPLWPANRAPRVSLAGAGYLPDCSILASTDASTLARQADEPVQAAERPWTTPRCGQCPKRPRSPAKDAMPERSL